MYKTRCFQAFYFVFFLLFGRFSLAQEVHSHADLTDQKMEHLLHSMLNNDVIYPLDIDSAKILLSWAEKQEGSYYEASANYIRLIYLRTSSLYETIVTGNNFAIECDLLPDRIQAWGLGTLLLQLQSTGRHEEILGLVVRICELRERMEGDKCCLELGKVYYDLKQYEQAISQFLINADYYRSKGDSLMVSSSYNNIGSCFDQQSKPDSAAWAYTKALKILGETSTPKAWNDSYSAYFANIIRWDLLETQQKDISSPQHQAMIKDIIRGAYRANEEHWVTKGYGYFAQLHYDAENLDLTMTYCDSAIAILTKESRSSGVPKFLDIKGRTMLLMGDKNGAKQVFLKSQNLKDSLDLVNSEIQGTVAAAFYESKEKEKEVARYSEEAKAAALAADQQRKNNRNVIIGALAISVLAFMLVILVFKLRRTQKVERLQQLILEQSLKDKEVLLKEIHHRVKNNLQVISSLLDLQTLKMEDGTAKSALEEGKSRVQSIAILHHQLYQHDDLVQVDLKTFSEELFKQVLSVFKKPEQQVEVSWKIETTMIDIDMAVPIGLIMNELFTNSFKYAFNDGDAGRIEMRLEKQTMTDSDDVKHTLVYCDSGPGLPADLELSSAKSLGLKLISKLSAQFKGTSSYRYNNGAEFSITF
jgi:two-component sensor histidine kinase